MINYFDVLFNALLNDLTINEAAHFKKRLFIIFHTKAMPNILGERVIPLSERREYCTMMYLI